MTHGVEYGIFKADKFIGLAAKHGTATTYWMEFDDAVDAMNWPSARRAARKMVALLEEVEADELKASVARHAAARAETETLRCPRVARLQSSEDAP